jgi:hypothetical protein
MNPQAPHSEPLSGEDLGLWWGDQPRQRTTMAMLLLLDRRPHFGRLRAAARGSRICSVPSVRSTSGPSTARARCGR